MAERTEREREWERERSRRKRPVRQRSINVRSLRKEVRLERETSAAIPAGSLVRRLNLIDEEPELPRPECRRDCIHVPRPCPYVGCKHNLYLDVMKSGSIKFNFPDLEPHEMAESCALDVAHKGGLILEEVAEIMNITRERVRQIEVIAKEKWRQGMADFAENDDEIRRVG